MKTANFVKFNTATTGTGTVTAGSAVAGYQLPSAAANLADGDEVRLTIEDGTAREVSRGTLGSVRTTVTRTLLESTTGALLNLSGSAVVFFDWAADDLIANVPIFDKSANFTAVIGMSYRLTGVGLTVTLPASPGAGSQPIRIISSAGSEVTSPHTIARTGTDTFAISPSAGRQTGLTGLNLNRGGRTFIFIPVTGGYEAAVG